MYTIFKNDTSIILTDDVKKLRHKNLIYWNQVDHQNVLLDDFIESKKEVMIYHDDISILWREFAQRFIVIEAAGGLVRNDRNEILFIYRFDKWDLPKGKIEAGESKEMAALREVMEECGIDEVKLGKALPTTYHIYEEKNRDILKVSYWFTMYSEEKKLKPQIEEGITEVRWIKESDLQLVMDNTYQSIEWLLNSYHSENQ